MNNETIESKKQLWAKPWGYIESFLIITALFLGAVIFEITLKKPAPNLTWPTNFILLIFFFLGSIALYFTAKKYNILQWFSSIPASIGAIVLFVSVSLIMALVPQRPETQSLFFIYKVTSSWTYYIAITYLLLVLGFVTIRRLLPFSHRNFGFALSHLGLWITIATAGLGAGDVQKYSMVLEEGKTVWEAYSKDNGKVQLDFAVKLLEFNMDEYPAKLAFVNASSGQFLEDKGKKAIFEPDTIHNITFKYFSVSTKKHLPNSVFYQNEYFPFIDYGTTQSCLIESKNSITGKTVTGWVGSSSVSQQPTYLYLDDSVVVAMLQPEAKKFTSYITVFEKSGEVYDTLLEVNKAIVVNNWKLYQTGYDEQKGKWSNISIVEIVKDPWLIYVYLGLFLMIGGAFYLIWFGRGPQKK